MSTKYSGAVEEYQFQSFSEGGNEKVLNYNFQNLGQFKGKDEKELHQKTIKIERGFATQNQFKINSIVEEHRGLKQQAADEFEARIQDEVEKRVAEISESAFKAGFEEGLSEGRDAIFNELRNEVEKKLEDFNLMINDVIASYEVVFSKQKNEMYALIKNLTKWIILRELDGDGKYVERLLEKLLQEIQVRHNLLIQVSEAHFQHMPEVLEHVQKKLGELKNVRVEIDS